MSDRERVMTDTERAALERARHAIDLIAEQIGSEAVKLDDTSSALVVEDAVRNIFNANIVLPAGLIKLVAILNVHSLVINRGCLTVRPDNTLFWTDYVQPEDFAK